MTKTQLAEKGTLAAEPLLDQLASRIIERYRRFRDLCNSSSSRWFCPN